VVDDGGLPATIVAELAQPGSLPAADIWLLGVGALAFACAAAATTELLVRRRLAAEGVASATRERNVQLADLSATLQHTLSPTELPDLDGLALAGTHRAGVRELGVGGDWYDAVPLDDGTVLLSMGDVSGKGDHAARLMSSLRHAVRAYAVQGDRPDEILVKLNDLVDVERDDCFATVVCARVDVAARTVELASAGHLAPLVLDGDGARYVALDVAPPVGIVGRAAARMQTTRLAVAPGTSLLFFTDGLVERPEARLDDGLDLLRETALECAGEDPAALLEGVVAVLAPGGELDDVALLVARFAGPSAPARNGASGERASFEASPSSVEAARDYVSHHLGGTPERLDTARLLVSELATNAIVHAGSRFEVEVAQTTTPGVSRVSVTDGGDGPVRSPQHEPRSEGGLGLTLVARLSRSWGVQPSAAGTCVWFELDGEPPTG
jgi:serine phosphatase RsbU (regulator of sigma subunit)/anti-sigma regulatory factor (Ser/Thr protein kinase)